jgi:hypothetical protein
MIWDFLQQTQISDLEGRTSRAEAAASRAASDATRRVDELEDRLDRMALVNTALFELLCAKLGVTSDEIQRKVQQVDLRDGQADGKLGTVPAAPCRKCNRPISRKHARCLYCGEVA